MGLLTRLRCVQGFRKDPDAGKNWGQEQEGVTEDEMVGWHRWLKGHEVEQAPGDSEDREAWRAAVHGVAKSQAWQQQQRALGGLVS